VPRPMTPPRLSETATDANDATDAICRDPQPWERRRRAGITMLQSTHASSVSVAFDLSNFFLRRLRPLRPPTNALIMNIVNVAAGGRPSCCWAGGGCDHRLTTARHAFAAAEPICRPKSGSQLQKFCTRVRASGCCWQINVRGCVSFAVCREDHNEY